MLRLAALSLRNRAGTAALTVLAIAVSVMLLLGVDKVRTAARDSFASTISGTDLIVGARSGSLNLLLYSIFRIGNATNNVRWASVEDLVQRPEVAWAVPLALGDSHFGFRVLGTTTGYFEHYRYRNGRPLIFERGGPFADLFDAVLGAEVAATLGYRLGDPIIVAHGLGAAPGAQHADKPFRVAGVLAKTGTPADRTVHVSLEAVTAIHVDWQGGARIPGLTTPADEVRTMDLTPRDVTAVLVGLQSRLATFRLQRWVNTYAPEPLTAILPGVALQELWSLVGTAETALAAVSALAALTAVLGMTAMLLATLSERRREMAILRSVGAHASVVFGLLLTEAVVLTALGALLGAALVYVALFALQPVIDARFGLFLSITPPTPREVLLLVAVMIGGALAGLPPALRAYRLSLADGMTVRT